MFVWTVLAPLLDITIGVILGFPLPGVQLLVLTVRLVGRHRQLPRAQKSALATGTRAAGAPG